MKEAFSQLQLFKFSVPVNLHFDQLQQKDANVQNFDQNSIFLLPNLPKLTLHPLSPFFLSLNLKGKFTPTLIMALFFK